ncbi:MAG TPA: type III PLP-dependent enzyme, partial [Bacilli bacterium]|nr:type III PLP-dependent enzyme [Bacilli bacterium]
YLARSIDLPPVSPGDVLTVPNVGAYGLSASLIGFLGREAPVEIVLDQNEVVHVSQLELKRIPRGVNQPC